MPKAKFWLIQFLTVAFVTVVLGSPAMAHGRGYKSYKGYYKTSYNHWKNKLTVPEQEDEKFKEMLERKISRQEKRIQWYEKIIERLSQLANNRRYARFKRYINYKIRRYDRVKAYAEKKLALYQKSLDEYNDKFNNDDDGGDTGGGDPVEVARAKCTELFGSVASFNESSFVCTNLITFESVQL